jgi:ribosome-binding factor A
METNPNRHEKMREALREVAAEFLAREAGPQSLITVTGASLSSEGRRGTVFITVLPESAEEAALAFANRNRREFGEFFEKRVRGVSVPRIEFVLDRGQKASQRLDDIQL